MKDLDVVRLKVSVQDDHGQLVPAGSEGTIVSTYDDGRAFCIEFTSPQEALADVEATELELIWSCPSDQR